MTFITNDPIPPKDGGFRIFVRAAYPAKYNFAVANYNQVSTSHKLNMRGGHLLLFRSVVAVVWIISMIFAILALIKAGFIIITIICSLFYLILSFYNLHIFFKNRSLLNATRLLSVKVPELNGADYEWINVPLHSMGKTGRLADVDQSALDHVRKEFMACQQNEIACMIYTKRYANTYPVFPRELILHIFLFISALVIGTILAIL